MDCVGTNKECRTTVFLFERQEAVNHVGSSWKDPEGERWEGPIWGLLVPGLALSLIAHWQSHSSSLPF